MNLEKRPEVYIVKVPAYKTIKFKGECKFE